MELNEYECIERVQGLSCILEEYGEIGALAIDHYCGDMRIQKKLWKATWAASPVSQTTLNL